MDYSIVMLQKCNKIVENDIFVLLIIKNFSNQMS